MLCWVISCCVVLGCVVLRWVVSSCVVLCCALRCVALFSYMLCCAVLSGVLSCCLSCALLSLASLDEAAVEEDKAGDEGGPMGGATVAGGKRCLRVLYPPTDVEAYQEREHDGAASPEQMGEAAMKNDRYHVPSYDFWRGCSVPV